MEAPSARFDAAGSKADHSARCPQVDPSAASHVSQTGTGDNLLSELLLQGGYTLAIQRTVSTFLSIFSPATTFTHLFNKVN